MVHYLLKGPVNVYYMQLYNFFTFVNCLNFELHFKVLFLYSRHHDVSHLKRSQTQAIMERVWIFVMLVDRESF